MIATRQVRAADGAGKQNIAGNRETQFLVEEHQVAG